MTGVVSHNEIVRHLSIKALGLSCILSKTLAKKYLVLFLQVCGKMSGGMWCDGKWCSAYRVVLKIVL